jgi:hypothetical protein
MQDFWQSINRTFFPSDSNWSNTIRAIVGELNAVSARQALQSLKQISISGIQGQGTELGNRVIIQPDWEVFQSEFPPEAAFTPEVLFFQWLYQFSLMEGCSKTFDDLPFLEWPGSIQFVVTGTAHALTYYSLLMLIQEENIEPPTLATWDATQGLVTDKATQVLEILFSKGDDYGQSFSHHGPLGVFPRIWDKMCRYVNLKGKTTSNHESVYDSILDLVGYSLILLSLTARDV